MEMDISKWTHLRTGEVREYITNWAELMGLEVTRYNTGNISSAVFQGETIANRRAAALLNAKVWRDKHGDIHVDRFSALAAGIIHKQEIMDFFVTLEENQPKGDQL